MIHFIRTCILRVGGIKSISQITIAQTIVMIGMVSLLIKPIAGKGLHVTFLGASLLILLMIIMEYAQVKIDFLETFDKNIV